VARNCATYTLPNGTRLFFSYKQLVGLGSPKIDIPTYVFTDQKFSVTTSRHVRDFLREYGGTVVDERAFAMPREEAGI
jgi:hypothetical protein